MQQKQRTSWTRQKKNTLPFHNEPSRSPTTTTNNNNRPSFSPKFNKKAGLFFFCVTLLAMMFGAVWIIDPVGRLRQREIERNFTDEVAKERLGPLQKISSVDDQPEVKMTKWGEEYFPDVCTEWSDVATIETCRTIKKFTKNGELLVSISNVGNQDMWENWAKSVIKAGVTNFVTFTMEKDLFEVQDPQLAEHLVSLPIHLSLMIEKGASSSQGNRSSFHDFRTSVYVVFMKSVPDLLLWVLKQNISVFYSDTDVVFLSNPFDAVHITQEKRSFNWLVQADGGFSNRQNTQQCKITVACGGIFYARYSSFSLRVAEEWVSAVKLNKLKASGNQKAYNLVISAIGKNSFGILPCDQFPNGYRYNEVHLGLKWRPSQTRLPVLVHNNWVVGKQNKIDAFKRWGMWLEELEEGAEIVPRMETDEVKVKELKLSTRSALKKNRDETKGKSRKEKEGETLKERRGREKKRRGVTVEAERGE